MANAVLLPIVLKRYGDCINKKLAFLAVECNLVSKDSDTKTKANAFINKIEELNKIFKINSYFEELNKEDIKTLARTASKEANPLYPVLKLYNSKQLEEIYY